MDERSSKRPRTHNHNPGSLRNREDAPETQRAPRLYKQHTPNHSHTAETDKRTQEKTRYQRNRNRWRKRKAAIRLRQNLPWKNLYLRKSLERRTTYRRG